MVPSFVRDATDELHEAGGVAAYFAVYRGSDVVVAYVSDCPEHPRLTPLEFGFHVAAHATAFGKIMLADMSEQQRGQYLSAHGMPPLNPATITHRDELERHLRDVTRTGIAWERDEFVPGKTCAAVGIRNAAGMIIGTVAISAETLELPNSEAAVELRLRECAAQVNRYYRSGPN